MSTFFKSAAMTLLSKTLQTLLYKYLSDVDVEGVNLPSLYNSDGHSGWGVRLSNVKLREGAKLMDLPAGGRKRKSNRRRRRQKHEKRASKSRDKQNNTQDEARQKESNNLDDGGVTTAEAGDPVVESAPNSTSSSQLKDAPPQSDEDGKGESSPSSGATDDRKTDAGAEADDSTQSTVATVSTTTTATTTTTSSSWFSWGYSSKPQPKTDPPPVLQEETGSPSEAEEGVPPQTVEENDGDNIEPNENDPLVGTIPKSEHDYVVEESHVEHDNMQADDEEEEGEEEDDDYEPPLILRLGAGSTIGILDVRLVGKDIHVYVEDAYLTIEAVCLNAEQSDDAKPDNEQGTPDKRRSSAKKKPDPPKSVYERVLAENAIARALSALPNLFIRDVRVRLVIRGEVFQWSPEQQEQQSTSNTTKYGPEDAIVEFSVELLSITDGEDFLSNYRTEFDPSGEEGLEPSTNRVVQEPYEDQNDNEYLVKRIRTGRGPEGGFSLRIYPPRRSLCGVDNRRDPLWAWHSWESLSKSYVVRCSGLDAQGRVYMGTKNEAVSGDDWLDSEYDDYDYNADAMLLGGVDYVAPGPQPPLPPMTNRQSLSEEEKFWSHEGATIYQTDANGIQSSAVNSSFHRVARGLSPAVCGGDHLPCENCAQCWEVFPGSSHVHPLDSSTPMGGLVLSILTRDPFEVNIDRPSLEVLGDVISLFKKKPEPKPASEEAEVSAAPGRPNDEGADEGGHSERSGFLSRSSRELSFVEAETKETVQPERPVVPDDMNDLRDSFPEYMQPETIQILGVHIVDLIFRVHVMREGDYRDEGLSFSFWDLEAKCLTFDYQTLNSTEKSFQDLRFDIGHLTTQEYIGSGNKQILSIGLRKRVVEFDEMTIETLKTLEELSDRPPWPNTAAALLDCQPPLETLIYEERDRHALQLRYIAVSNPSGPNAHRKRSHANFRFGPASIDVPYAIKDQIPTTISEARATVFGPPEESEQPAGKSDQPGEDKDALKLDSVLNYKIHMDGGCMRLDPRIELKLPRTIITGDRSSEFGLFFQTLLERVHFSYGEPDPSRRILERGLSLQQLASLPESVRLRVLLFLPDLRPMEKALCVKPEPNSFLRCRSVNKGIVRIAKKVGRRSRNSGTAKAKSNSNRRQELMAELLKMDDDMLEDVVLSHQRYLRQSSQRS